MHLRSYWRWGRDRSRCLDRSGERSGHLGLGQGRGGLYRCGGFRLNRYGRLARGRFSWGTGSGSSSGVDGGRHGRWRERGEEEALHLSVGHGGLHQLLPRGRDDGHALGYDLQLALRLPLTLDHNSQTRVSFLSTLGELQELGHGQFDLSLLGSRGCGRLSCSGRTGSGRRGRLNC